MSYRLSARIQALVPTSLGRKRSMQAPLWFFCETSKSGFPPPLEVLANSKDSTLGAPHVPCLSKAQVANSESNWVVLEKCQVHLETTHFLLTPGVLSGAISMTNRWEEVQLGHQKWFPATHWAGPWGGKAVLIAGSERNQEFQSLPRPPHNHVTTPLPCGSCFFLLYFTQFYFCFHSSKFLYFSTKKKIQKSLGRTVNEMIAIWCLAAMGSSVSFLSIEGKTPVFTLNHLEVETLPTRQLPSKPTL